MPRSVLLAIVAAASMVSSIAHANVIFPDDMEDDSTEIQQPAPARSRPTPSPHPSTPKKSVGGARLFYGGKLVDVEVNIVEKAHGDNKYLHAMRTASGVRFYVIVASARLEGTIDTRTIDTVASCSGARPYLGRTQPGQGSFQFSASAVYFGPYMTRDQALAWKNAFSGCAPEAYIASGNIDRY